MPKMWIVLLWGTQITRKSSVWLKQYRNKQYETNIDLIWILIIIIIIILGLGIVIGVIKL
jgi:hypothetical protein